MRFSDRIGVTKIPNTLQIDDISFELRNSLWNYLLETITSENSATRSNIIFILGRFIKIPVDILPKYKIQLIETFHKFFHETFQWFHVYNLFEFIAENFNKMRLRIDSSDFETGVNIILEEEMSGYRFIGGILAPLTNSEEINCITSIIELSQENIYFGAKEHIKTALSLMSQKPTPEYRNSIKESISAIESIANKLTSESGGGLEKALSKLESDIGFHKGFKKGLLALYGYTSDESGIRHAILDKSDIGFDEAQYMLVICSAIVNFIISKANKNGLV